MAAQVDSNSNRETDADDLERQHFQKVMEAFLSYEDYSSKKLTKVKESYCKLPRRHQIMLPDFIPHLENIRECINTNQKFLCSIANSTGQMFENRDNNTEDIKREVDSGNKMQRGAATQFDMDKVTTTLRQFVRDWSDEGQEERAACYRPILDELKQLFPPTECSVQEVSVLIPGAGLGRLMFEVAQLGYNCQGNEWSLYMLFASHYILNRCPGRYHTTIHPFVHQWCNNRCSTDQIRPIKIPDIDPSSIPQNLNFSMAAGDFLQVYHEEDSWDCVATCFFIDTAHNIIAYIENIWKILKPGAYWINLGPLLYHFADIPNEWSIELSYQDIRKIITEDFQLELLKEDMSVSSGYIDNKQSMLNLTYQNVFFVARKPLKKTSNMIRPGPSCSKND